MAVPTAWGSVVVAGTRVWPASGSAELRKFSALVRMLTPLSILQQVCGVRYRSLCGIVEAAVLSLGYRGWLFRNLGAFTDRVHRSDPERPQLEQRQPAEPCC